MRESHNKRTKMSKLTEFIKPRVVSDSWMRGEVWVVRPFPCFIFQKYTDKRPRWCRLWARIKSREWWSL